MMQIEEGKYCLQKICPLCGGVEQYDIGSMNPETQDEATLTCKECGNKEKVILQ